MAKIVIAELDIDIQSLLKTTSELKKQIDVLKNSQKELAASGQSTSEAFVENEAVLKSLNSAYSNNIKVITESGKATAQQADQAELLSLALTKEVTSITEAREQNKLLNKLRNETNTTTVQGQAQLAALNSKLDENNAYIKANGDQYLQQKLNIGNYKESITEAFQEMNIFNGGIGGFIQRSQEAGGVTKLLSNSFGGIIQGIVGMTRASLAFIATPIGAVIAAIGLVVGALVEYLSSSQEGIDAVTAVTRPLQAILSSLMGVIQNVGKYLFEAFSNPKKTLTELYEFVKQNLINRFTAFGKILEGIITLDFKKVTNGVLQAGTGVENLTDKIGKAAQSTGKFLDDAIKKGQQIDALKKQIERSELAYQRQQIKTNDLIDQQLLISKDTSRTFAERGAAANEIIRLTTELSKKEEEIIQKKITALKLEYSMKNAKAITIAEQQKLIDLEKSLDEAQDRGINARIEQSKVLSGLKKEQAAQDKEAHAKEVERQNKIIDAQLTKSKQEIELFKAQQGFKEKSSEETYKFQKELYDKELADLNLNYKKGKISKLEYETQKITLSTNFAKQQADIVVANAEAELNSFYELNKSKLLANKFLTDELLKQELDRLAAINKAEQDNQAVKLQQGVINQEQYNLAIKDIDTKYTEQKTKLEEDKKIADTEKAAIDLENKLLQSENDFTKKQADLERNRIAELNNAEKTGADKDLINKKYALNQKQIDTELTNFKLNAYSQTFKMIGGMFGENTILAKAAAIADIGITTYLKAFESFAQAKVFFSNPLTAALGVNAQIQGGLTIAQGALAVAKVSGVKFEQGGIQEVGGNRHSHGGTKFYGEDGTMFEAERGEGIGVLNRGAYAAFMDFNNSFGSGRSGNGLFAGGGIITQGVKPQTADLTSIVDAIVNMPAPVVAVEEIQTVGNRYVSVKQNADF